MFYLLIVLAGFFTGWGTALILGEKALRLPGGSLAVGVSIALANNANFLAGASLGILGWALFCLSFRILYRPTV